MTFKTIWKQSHVEYTLAKPVSSEKEKYFSKEYAAKKQCPLTYGVERIAISGPSSKFTQSSINAILAAASVQILAEGYYQSQYGLIAHKIAHNPKHTCYNSYTQAFSRVNAANKAFWDVCSKTGLKAHWEPIDINSTD
jgi:hypothetical protein